ncbi:hypothetical protein [Novosphingobium sp. P6W]|uniref:hypothetical protein n=1 Tax=Novosphingobium sp. P6W TaxID=1609758 RepID=UPI0005C2CBD9|nr:hypothetical protein [Novosphingobium sp. P6W]AXB76677.1 hypothetical protein TQ38_009425 [Novosphingobium sp. P6W]KIS33463.1 hypothetical protein TQ38_08690 [Novosphingobium sp. P6W]
MSQTAMIMSVISLIGCLILVTRNSQLRSLGTGKTMRLVAIWAVIIVGLVLVIQLSGFRIQP